MHIKKSPFQWSLLSFFLLFLIEGHVVPRKEDDFFHSTVIKDLDTFKTMSDVIVANRLENALLDVETKVYTRDIFREK
jgi:hypothetical protein